MTHVWRKVFLKSRKYVGSGPINAVFVIVCVSQMMLGHPWDRAETAWDTELMGNS